MFKILSQTDDKTIDASPDDTILQATLKAQINHTHVCGGNARCTTCRVHIIDGLKHCQPKNEKENFIVKKLGFQKEIRLACQTKIRGDITIRRLVVDDLDIKIILQQLDDASSSKFGQEKEIAILCTDIENYTQFAEEFPAYDVVHVLNRYYQMMNEIIVDHNGIISDVAGDGILALFGVLEDGGNSVLNAINTVRAMNAALIQFNEYLKTMYGWSFKIRAGINFGKVIVGSFDTGVMRKISAIGDEVNLASLIETANKEFGTKLLISESAKKQVKGLIETHKVHRTKFKGKSKEYFLYFVET